MGFCGTGGGEGGGGGGKEKSLSVSAEKGDRKRCGLRLKKDLERGRESPFFIGGTRNSFFFGTLCCQCSYSLRETKKVMGSSSF